MKAKFYALTFLAFALYFNAKAQCTWMSLTTQAQVDAFPSTGCTSLSEGLKISGSDITHLDSLYKLTFTQLLLIENNENLIDLDGLQNLTRVYGELCCAASESFTISGNARLENIDALSGVTTIGNNLAITDNPVLQNVDGFSALTRINTTLRIINNASLTDLDGFSSLTYIGDNSVNEYPSLQISDNPSLNSVAGLSGVPGLPSDLHILNNDALTSLDGLNNIVGSIGSLRVVGNASLANIDALSSITSVADGLTIEGNGSLPNLNGLRSLQAIGSRKFATSGVRIIDNEVLRNVDSLQRLRMSDSNMSLLVTNNPNLTKGCGLYGLLTESFSCTECNVTIDISGNGQGVTEQAIREDGPCTRSSNPQCNGDVRLATQAEVDAFAATGCTTIAGRLSIIGGDDITHLDSLYRLTYVGELHIIAVPNLTDLDGLEQLTKVGNNACCVPWPTLEIGGHPNLTNINGLSGLTSVGGRFDMTHNKKLTNVDGLSSLTYIHGDFTIASNDVLANLDGLSSLTHIGTNSGFGQNSLSISRNPSLASISGLRNVAGALPGSLTILGNDPLTSLDGLQNITSIAGQLTIAVNESLVNVEGLSSLTSAAYVLQILDNPELQNLDGLRSFESLGGKTDAQISIVNNPKLTNVNGLSHFTTVGPYNRKINVTNNVLLTEGCGLYPVLTTSFVCGPCSATVTISGNGAGVSEQSIREGGPCDGSGAPPTTATNLTFSFVRTNSMSLTFERGEELPTGGYLILMKKNGSPSPDNMPTDGVDYPVGSPVRESIVVSRSFPGTINVNDLEPGTNYYFAIVAYSEDFHYENEYPLLGSQATASICTGDIVLNTQAKVDEFPSYGCTTVGGRLTISGSTITHLDSLYNLTEAYELYISRTNVTNLHGLEQFTEVTSGCCMPWPVFTIDFNDKLESIDALSALTLVGGSTLITNNQMLTNLDGLSSLNKVGGQFQITNNAALTDLDGLSSLTTIGKMTNFGDGSLGIANNPSLTSIAGLSNVTALPGHFYISDNDALTNLDGLEGITSVGGVLEVSRNAALANIDGLSSITSAAYAVYILDNAVLPNLDGLSSFKFLGGKENAELKISNNSMLQNVDGLSSFTSLGPPHKILTVVNNPNLTRGCGLYPLLTGSFVCSGCRTTITISGNGEGVSQEEIYAGGSCDGTQPGHPTKPTNMVFSEVTASSLRISYSRGEVTPTGGYIVMMRVGQSSFPTNMPFDGMEFTVGTHLGIQPSSLVVANGMDTTHVISGLQPNTHYFFEVVAYTSDFDYLQGDPLSGNQMTTTETSGPATNMVFSDVTDNSMTVSFTPSGANVDGYLTLMRAFGSPYPDEPPQNGTHYSVGQVIGSSTIVVGTGLDTTKYIVYLMPDVEYYFVVIPYVGAIYQLENSLSGHQRTNNSAPYPNPFVENLSIPFTVSSDNTDVRILISDQTGRPVAEVVNQSFAKGKHVATWDRTSFSGDRAGEGIYIYSIASSGGAVQKGKIVAK